MNSRKKVDVGKQIKYRKHNAIKSCEIYPEIHEWLVGGLPVDKVVVQIHERGFLKELKPCSLRQALIKYLKDVPPGEIVSKKIPLIVIRALKRIEPVIETIKAIQGTIEFYKNRLEKKWNMIAKTETRLERMIEEEIDPEYAAQLLQNLFKMSEGVEADTIKLIHLYKLLIDVQVDAGLIQRNLGTLDLNVVKYETSIREISKKSNMKVEKIEALLKNPQSMYKVLDFVKSLRNADPKIIDRMLKEDRKMLEENKK